MDTGTKMTPRELACKGVDVDALADLFYRINWSDHSRIQSFGVNYYKMEHFFRSLTQYDVEIPVTILALYALILAEYIRQVVPNIFDRNKGVENTDSNSMLADTLEKEAEKLYAIDLVSIGLKDYVIPIKNNMMAEIRITFQSHMNGVGKA